MVNAQMLSELEEVIQYKLVPERREAIKQMWWDRLQVRHVTLPVLLNDAKPQTHVFFYEEKTLNKKSRETSIPWI